jgi:N-acetyl-gamma-glutamyl-phosphate reductase
MGARVAVAGASGYAGGELLRLLAGHPDLELAVVTADSSAGKTVGELHPHLAGVAALADRVFEPHEAACLAGCDLVFAALPAGQSAALAATIPAPGADHLGTDDLGTKRTGTGTGHPSTKRPGTEHPNTGQQLKIVDLGPDFRLADPAAWARHYGGEHAGRWVTGLPELPGMRAQIAAASRVAAPGCYATAVIMALAPVVAAGLVQPQDIVVVAASGTSGAGRSLRTSLLASEVMGSLSAYQVGGAHRHTAEIEQALASAAGNLSAAGNPSNVTVSFTPVLAPMPRGILATCTARLAGPHIDTAQLRAAIAAAYAGEEFACLLPEGRWPSTAAVAGSNGAQFQVVADERAGRAIVVAAIDNLGKGAAGQAIQNANLMLGLPEGAGLTASGVAP